MRTITWEDDEAVDCAERAHSNHQYGGYCCPHCLQTSDHNLYGTEDREVVRCDHCDEPFVIWNVATVEQCSGKLES